MPHKSKKSKLEAAGILEDDRQKYKLGKVVSKLLGKGKKKSKAKDSEDIDTILSKMSDEELDTLTDIDKEMLLDMQLEKWGIEGLEGFTTDNIDKILANMPASEIARLTKADIDMLLELEADKLYREGLVAGGPIDEQMDTVMQTETVPSAVETHTMPDGTEMPGATHEEYEASMPDMESDDVMEDDYLEFVLEEALTPEEQSFLTQELEQNTQLATIFDKVIDVAQEFAGSGPVEGPGSGTSDSIPARLSDGEFVFTAEAVEEIGADNLQQMMEAAEASADQRQPVANGGYMNGDDEYNRRQPLTEEEQLLDMQRANPRRFYRPISG